MTFREKLKQDNPEFTEEYIDDVINADCPDNYSYEDESDCDCVKKVGAESRCNRCWDREMPNTEPKADGIPVIPQSEVDAYNKGHADGMAQGMSDAWEFIKKCWYNGVQNSKKIFGYEFVIDILENYTPQEAMAKLKAYEETQKIEVGDVVEADTHYQKMVVTQDRGDKVYCVDNTGAIGCYGKESIKKTGKHIDISSILEQIGGE